MKYSLKLYNFCEHHIASPFGTLPFAEVSAGYPPPKTSKNRKIESALGTTLGMREKASLLSFHIPSCPARFFFLIGLCEEEGFF